MRDVTAVGAPADDRHRSHVERRPTRDAIRRSLVTPSGRRVHVAKMFTWRVAATATTVVVTFAVTGDLLVGATVGGIEAFAKMALYYWHERVWASVLAEG